MGKGANSNFTGEGQRFVIGGTHRDDDGGHGWVGVFRCFESEHAGGDFENASPFERVFGIKETRVKTDGAVKIEAADVEQASDGDVGVLAALEFGDAVDGFDAGFEGLEVGGGGEVSFVEKDGIRKGDLFDGFCTGIEVKADVASIDE